MFIWKYQFYVVVITSGDNNKTWMRTIDLPNAIMIGIGIMLGSGIFVSPGGVMQNAGSYGVSVNVVFSQARHDVKLR